MPPKAASSGRGPLVASIVRQLRYLPTLLPSFEPGVFDDPASELYLGPFADVVFTDGQPLGSVGLVTVSDRNDKGHGAALNHAARLARLTSVDINMPLMQSALAFMLKNGIGKLDPRDLYGFWYLASRTTDDTLPANWLRRRLVHLDRDTLSDLYFLYGRAMRPAMVEARAKREGTKVVPFDLGAFRAAAQQARREAAQSNPARPGDWIREKVLYMPPEGDDRRPDDVFHVQEPHYYPQSNAHFPRRKLYVPLCGPEIELYTRLAQVTPLSSRYVHQDAVMDAKGHSATSALFRDYCDPNAVDHLRTLRARERQLPEGVMTDELHQLRASYHPAEEKDTAPRFEKEMADTAAFQGALANPHAVASRRPPVVEPAGSGVSDQ